jgi:hypothetical protein
MHPSMRAILTSVEVDALSAAIWRVLVDLPTYPT